MESFNFNKTIKMQNRLVGEGHPVFIIAEAGVNHFGNLKKAKSLVDLAVEAKADAFKIQVFKTENLICQESVEWRSRLQSKELTYNTVREIKHYCQRRGILFLATAHEEESLSFIESLDLQAYKIGSGEVNNLSFIKEVAKRNKPIILSTGMYTIDEVGQALEVILSENNRDVIILHCVTLYPSPPEEVNLKAIDTIQKEFNVLVGYSDHTVGHEIPLAAVARGACLIEKHITIDRDIPNAQDWKVSCGPEDFPQLIQSVRKIEAALGTGIKAPGEIEIKSKSWARKSLVAAVDIQEGEIITSDKLCAKRPGLGIIPTEINNVIGKKAKKNIRKDTLIKWEQLI
jgi:N-acetylneuraminate synthase/N,N'-diacetyllegionaminate synthase